MARSASPCVRTKQHKHTWSELTVRVGQLVGGHHPEFGRAGRRDCHRLELLHDHLVDHVRRAGRFGGERSGGLVGLQSGGGFDLPRLVVDDGDRFFVVVVVGGLRGRRGSRLVVAEPAQFVMSIGKSISHRRRRLVEIPRRRGDAGALPTEYADGQPHRDGKPDGGGGHHGSVVFGPSPCAAC